MRSLAITYACPACHAACPATVTHLDEPASLIDPRSADLLRTHRAALLALGQEVPVDDPVDEVAAELLVHLARLRLRYATCPRCSTRNPDGLEKDEADRRRDTWGVFAFNVLLAGGAWLSPWVVVVVVLVNLLIMRPLSILQARKLGLAIPWRQQALSVLISAAMLAVVAWMPRAAPALPLISGIWFVLFHRAPSNDANWTKAAAEIRFDEA